MNAILQQMKLGDLAEALATFTRLPVPMQERRGVNSAWAWPLVGLVVMFGAWFVASVAGWFGVTDGLAAAAALVFMVMVSGAMHEDGLADCCDGFWGGNDPARRLDIMKDSQIGTYGVLGLVLSLLIRWHALTMLLSVDGHLWLLLAIGVLSRLPMVVLMNLLPPARETGLSADMGAPSGDTVLIGFGIVILVTFPLLGFALIPALVVLGAVSAVIVALTNNKISGQTGDVLGASQQVSEVALLALFVSLAI